MGKQSGSILIQTLVNLMIYSFFLIVSVQAMQLLSQPFTIDDYKVAYVQLQLDYLSELYQGVDQESDVCFTREICLKYTNHRLILTPGHQILLESIEDFNLVKQDQTIIISLTFQGIERKIYVQAR